MKIIIISLSVSMISSVVYNIVQYQNIQTYVSQIQSQDEEIQNVTSRITDLENEKYNLESEISNLNSEISKAKQVKLSTEKVETLYRSKYDLEIRSQMTKGSAVIGDVPAGAVVEVLESFFGGGLDGKWKIRYKGVEGWVPTQVGDYFSGQEDIFERVK
jgi:hypothetical protein